MKRTCLALIIIAVFMVLSALVVPRDALAWDVVLEDTWHDYWRLNVISEDNDAIYYDGEWEWRSPINGQTTGKAAAVLLKGDCKFTFYNPATQERTASCTAEFEGVKKIQALRPAGSLALTGWYSDGDTGYNVLYPYTAWWDDFFVYRWYGVRHWVRDTQYTDNIYMTVTEGQIWIYRNYDW